DLFVAQALFLALFQSPLSRQQGEFIGEQRIVTGRMNPLAIPADSLRFRKQLFAVNTPLHCQLLVFVCAHRSLQDGMSRTDHIHNDGKYSRYHETAVSLLFPDRECPATKQRTGSGGGLSSDGYRIL